MLGKIGSYLGIFILFIFTAHLAMAQVRFIQWADAHSTLETKGQQLAVIDELGQEFLQNHPNGEVVIYVVGDYTSINAYNSKEGGWLSFPAIKILREKGYTVLFTPGNHDAFDWMVHINGADLFIEQMKLLREWGVHILVDNLRGKTPDLKKITRPSYPLRTVHPLTHVVGLTIPRLMSRSNLNEERAQKLFQHIEPYKETFARVFEKMDAMNVEQVIFGVHQGHEHLKRQVPIMNEVLQKMESSVRVPLMLGAHDHLIAATSHKGTFISSSGSHGAIGVVDLDKEGKVRSQRVRNFAISHEQAQEVQPRLFPISRLRVNPYGQDEVRRLPWLRNYLNDIDHFLEQGKVKLDRIRGHLKFEMSEHKRHMQRGPSTLGSLLSEVLVHWAKKRFALKPQEVVIGMTNSNSYHLEQALEPGALKESTLRKMYHFDAEAKVFRLKGKEIQRLYFSLRKFYANGATGLHSPQLSFNVREHEGKLYLKDERGQWAPIQRKKTYVLALDGWLSGHQYGQSYRLPEWLSALKDKDPMAKDSYQELLVQYFPRIIAAYQSGMPLHPKHPLSCRSLF